MKFESILGKPHVPDKYAIAHPLFPVFFLKHKEVVTFYTEPFFRQLGTPFASFLYGQCR